MSAEINLYTKYGAVLSESTPHSAFRALAEMIGGQDPEQQRQTLLDQGFVQVISSIFEGFDSCKHDHKAEFAQRVDPSNLPVAKNILAFL